MSLLIVTQSSQLSQKLTTILSHYFTPSNPQAALYVKTKYYTCDVPIKICSPSDLPAIGEGQKIDLLLFLFDHSQLIEDIQVLIDANISKFRPQSQIVIVNSPSDTEEDWQYQQKLMNCQNFVSVVYEDLQNVQKTRPQWKQGGLLSENQEQFDIFGLFELIQTTIWTNSIKISQKNKDNAVQHKKQDQESKNIMEQKNEQNVSSSKKQEAMDEQQNYEEDEEKLQKQMMEFQMLMQQMMSMKDTNLKGNQRKMKAEQLIMKLTGNLNF